MRKIISLSVKKVKKESLAALKLYMKQAGNGFLELLNEEKNREKPEKAVLYALNEINDEIKKVDKQINSSSVNFPINEVIDRCKEIISLFKKLDPKRRSLKKTIMAIDSFVMANSSALYYKDAEYIINVPYMKRLTIFRRESFAKAVLNHFPYFHGCTVSSESDSKAVDVSFNVISESEDIKSLLKVFKPEIEKLLNWEMQKIGDGMYYEIHLLKQGSLGMIYLEMDVEPIVYDPGS